MYDTTSDRNSSHSATGSTLSYSASEMAPHADWTDMNQTDHFVQIYESSDFIVRAVAEYVTYGIKSGETCIVVATPEHREGIKQLVTQFGAELNTNDRYVALDARETLDKFAVETLDQEMFDEVIGGLVSKAEKRGPVRIFCEMVAVLLADGRPADALKLEDMWNKLREKHRFSLFCAYPTSELTRSGNHDFMAGVCGGHSKVIPDETYTSLLSEDRLKRIALLQQRNRQLEAELAAYEARASA